MTMKKDLSTNENQRYWKFVEETTHVVSQLPPWIRQLAGTEEADLAKREKSSEGSQVRKSPGK